MEKDSEEMQWKIDNVGDKHIGFYHHRLTSDNPRELMFSLEWIKENEKRSYINRGHGILQDLFIDDNGVFHHTITPNDKLIAATVVQWFGSNCGMAFLETVLGRCGYKIVPIKD